MLICVASTIRLFVAPLSGKMCDCYGRRFVLLFCGCFYTIMILLLATSTNIITFCFYYFLQSIPRGMGPIALAIYLSENLPTHNRGKMFLIFTMFIPIGLAVSSFVAWVILDDFTTGDWRLYLYVLGIIHIILLSFACWKLPISPRWLIFDD